MNSRKLLPGIPGAHFKKRGTRCVGDNLVAGLVHWVEQRGSPVLGLMGSTSRRMPEAGPARTLHSVWNTLVCWRLHRLCGAVCLTLPQGRYSRPSDLEVLA